MNFKALHYQEKPLILANVWDVSSAKIAEKLGFDAMGTSSAAMATMLGYEDGEHMPFEVLLSLIERIVQSTSLPLSVDIEAGYSRDVNQILTNIEQLTALGVVGINIEDSVVNTKRELIAVEIFTQLVAQIKAKFGDQLFVNARTDSYLLGMENTLQKTLLRIASYEQAGADGVFIPCLTDNQAIKVICEATALPVNLMSMPDLADFSVLQSLGVRRLSSGNFAFEKSQSALLECLAKIQRSQCFNGLFE